MLPWLYILSAISTAFFAVAWGALKPGAAPPRRSVAASGATTLLLAVGAMLDLQLAVGGLYLFAESYATVTSVRFWAHLGERFDARQAKRLFGVIGGFGMAGSILGGVVGGLGGVVGVVPTIVFSAITMFICAWMGLVLERRREPVAPRAQASSRPRFLPGARARGLFRDRYARALIAVAAVASVLTVVSDYLFRVSVQGHLSEKELAAIFGIASLVMGILATIFQLFLSSRMLSRFGIFVYLGITPALTLLAGLWGALRPGLAPAFSLKVAESLGSLSLHPTGMQLLYGPLPDGTRVSARSLIDGLVKKGGAALGGAALVLLAGRIHEIGLAGAVAALSAGFVALLFLVKRHYVATIDARLSRSSWGEQMPLDAAARSVLLKALTDPEPARALMAANLLAADRNAQLSPWVRVLLSHSGERVRARGVQLAAELGIKELVPRLRAMVESDERRPRDEAVFALARLDSEARVYLEPKIASQDPGLRAAAVGALLRLELERGEPGGPAAEALERMLQAENPSPAERRELAKLVGRLKGTRYTAALDRLLADPDESVRRLAVLAAGECGREELAPQILAMLGQRQMRRAAREALAAMGDEIADLLETSLNDKALAVQVRYELPRLLRYVRTSWAAHTLLFSNIEDDPFLRYRIALALSRMRGEDEELRFERERVEAAVLRRVEAYLYYLPIFQDLRRALGPEAILVRVLADRLDQNLEIAFRLLGLVYPHRSMLNVFNRFVSGQHRERAYALELFENLVEDPLRTRVLPLLERCHRFDDGVGEVERSAARLLELAVSRDAVLRACAIYTLRRHAPEAEKVQIIQEGAVSENVIEKVFLLEGVGIFEKCGVDDLAALAAIARDRRFEAGAVIYKENDPGDMLYVVVEGRVSVEKDCAQILEAREKEAFGEVSILDGSPRPAGARAISDVRTLVIDRQDFLDLVSDRPEILKGVFSVLMKQLRLVLEMAAAGRVKGPQRAVTDPQLAAVAKG